MGGRVARSRSMLAQCPLSQKCNSCCLELCAQVLFAWWDGALSRVGSLRAPGQTSAPHQVGTYVELQNFLAACGIASYPCLVREEEQLRGLSSLSPPDDKYFSSAFG